MNNARTEQLLQGRDVSRESFFRLPRDQPLFGLKVDECMARANARLDAKIRLHLLHRCWITTMPCAYFGYFRLSSAKRGLSSEVWPGPLVLAFGENKHEMAWEQRRLVLNKSY